MTWSNQPKATQLSAASFDELAAYIRKMRDAPAPLFIRPTYALLPPRWFCATCRHAITTHLGCDACTSCLVDDCVCNEWVWPCQGKRPF